MQRPTENGRPARGGRNAGLEGVSHGTGDGADNATEQLHSQLTRQRRWALANPEKRKAHHALEKAIRRGVLTKQPCAVYGAVQNVDFHHYPAHYDQPLRGQFLCRLHHVAEHRRLRAVKARP